MALNTFDASLHHIGLGAAGGTSYGFQISGRRRQAQRESLGAQEFGGASDLIGQAPSTSRWTQDDFTGGSYSYNWGKDDAMFADCTGFMSDAQGKGLISCPPMVQKTSEAAPSVCRNIFMVGGFIFLVYSSKIRKYNIGTGAFTDKNAPANSTYLFADYEPTDGMIWAICNTTVADDAPFVERIVTSSMAQAGTDGIYSGDADMANLTTFGGAIRDQNVVLQAGRQLWIGDPPARHDPSIAGEMTWTRIGRLPGRWKDSIAYNGMLYILCNDGGDSPSFRTELVAFDGDAVLPICVFPHSFYGKTIVEYGGRVFAGGTGTDVNGGEHYAELYEVTGSSVRLVRSFSPETRNAFLGGTAGEWPQSIDDLAVHEGLLWFCQLGKKMIAYDLTSDGIFGAAEIQTASLNLRKLVTGRGRLWAEASDGIYRISQPADTVSAWNPTLITSDFMYEPAMKKRWGQLRVMSRYAGCSSIEYSINGGESWTSLSVSVSSSYGKIFYSDADLTGIDPVEHIRFRIKLNSTSPTDAKTYHRELVAYTVSFAMLDTGKTGWSFTVLGAEEIETRNAELAEATTQAQDTSDLRDQMWSWYTGKTRLTFRDIDDTNYTVQMVDLVETTPLIPPDATSETEPESDYIVTLLEV